MKFTIVLERPAQAVAATLQAADMNCPVCLNIQVDPCTVSCGHSICQLCLARLWKSNEKFCPLCKQMWREFPAISYDYRASIEGSHRQEVDQIRKQYTEKDKQCVKRFVEARNSSLKSEETALKTSSTDSEVFKEDICEPKNQPQPLLTDQPPMDVQPQQQAFSKDMSYEQLAMWLSNHLQFTGKGYLQDISKLKDAKINGFALLNLNEERLDRLGMSMGFHVTLMSIIEDLKSSQQPQDSKRLRSQQQLSPAGSATHQTTQHQQTTFQAAINLDDIPKLDELLILKYMDKGEKKKIRIISEASHKWTDIAILICSDTNVTSVLEQKYHGDPNKCLKQTFISYFISKKPQRYTQDWNGLIELLDDVDLETLAENVKHALPNACT